MNKNLFYKILFFLSFILLALASRFIESIPNFSSFLAMAMFAGILFPKNKLSLIFPFAVQIGLDLTLGLYAYDFTSVLIHVLTMYSSLALIVFVGRNVSKRFSFVNTLLGAISSTVLFFLITNAGSWVLMPQYSSSISGLINSYMAALPFFKNSFVSGILYSAIMFGAYQLFLVGSREKVTAK